MLKTLREKLSLYYSMNSESKRAKAFQKAGQELSAFTPLCLASGVLYGTCVVGEALVIFERGVMDFFKPKSAANAVAMQMKFLSYRAVAAGAAFYVPPPLSMPSQSQQTQLRALRFTRLGVGIGTVAIVATSVTWAYRQGVNDFEEEVLDGVLPISLHGNSSPYVMNDNLVVRFGQSAEVTAMLANSERGGPRPLPVLFRGRPGGGRGEYVEKKKLRAAVKSASKGLNKGCYLRQDALGAVLSLPKGNQRRVIVQAGGWDALYGGSGVAVSKRRQARHHRSLEKAVHDLQESTGAEVAVVLLRNGAVGGAASSLERVVEIDARLPLLCEVVRWIDKRSSRRRVVATSFFDGQSGGGDSGGGDGAVEEWLLVERVGSGARELAVGAWVRAKEAHEQVVCSLSQAWQRVHVLWSQVRSTSSEAEEGLVVRVREGVGSLARGAGSAVLIASRAVYEGGAGALSKAQKVVQQLLVVSMRRGQNKRRSVLIDAGDNNAGVSAWGIGWWRATPPLSHYLCGGLRAAGVNAALIPGNTPESLPQRQVSDADAPLVLVCHEGSGSLAEQKALGAAATYRSRGYDVCVITRSRELGTLSSSSGVSRISTEAVSKGVWMAASELISRGTPLPEVREAMRLGFDETLYKVDVH